MSQSGKSNTQQCGGLLGTAEDTLVLALEFADDTVLDSPETIKRVLRSASVQKAIRTAALAEAKALTKKHIQGKPVTSDDVSISAGKVATAGASAASEAGLKEIQKSSEFRRLKEGLKQLECSYKKSPVGVFVDRNSGWLILVGAGLAFGGAAAMYAFKTGDAVASPAAKLTKKLVRFKVLGKVEVSLKDVSFEPSSRTASSTTMATGKWQKVDATLELSVAFKNDQLQSAGGRGAVVLRVAEGLTVDAHAAGAYQRPAEEWHEPLTYDLGVGLTYVKSFGQSRLSVSAMAFGTQQPTERKLGGSATADLNLKRGPDPLDPSVSVSLSARANELTNYEPLIEQKKQQDFAVTLGIQANF